MFQFPAFASYTLFYSGADTLSQCLETQAVHKTDWIFQAFKVGCPIRRSMDQSLFAAPHGFSQRITSFFACACQGIHQMPLIHFFVLIVYAHPYLLDLEFLSSSLALEGVPNPAIRSPLGSRKPAKSGYLLQPDHLLMTSTCSIQSSLKARRCTSRSYH